MTLIERIYRALDKGVDTARFERAAVALLPESYRDGDVPAPYLEGDLARVLDRERQEEIRGWL